MKNIFSTFFVKTIRGIMNAPICNEPKIQGDNQHNETHWSTDE